MIDPNFTAAQGAEVDRLMRENERLRVECDVVNRSFQELCDALNCEYDNEAALLAIEALKEPG